MWVSCMNSLEILCLSSQKVRFTLYYQKKKKKYVGGGVDFTLKRAEFPFESFPVNLGKDT